MIIKEDFKLLKNVPNFLHISKEEYFNSIIKNSPRKLFVVIDMFKNRINHFSKDTILNILSDINKREIFRVLSYEKYPLPVSYDKKFNKILLNILPLGTSDFSKLDQKEIYSLVVYAYSFYRISTKKVIIKDNLAQPIKNFLLNIFMRLYGKTYGLLGGFSTQINSLDFLLSCYILNSFFGITGIDLYRFASSISKKSFKDYNLEELNNFDFSNIKDFINSLDFFKVMPGINVYIFASKMLNYFGYNFLPALEDISRFISIIVTTSFTGIKYLPTFIDKYDITNYNTIIKFSEKNIF